MRNLWAASADSLLTVMTVVRGGPTDAVLSRLMEGRSGAASPSWPATLSQLSGMEAALLQDMTWWGTMMEERLHRWSDERDGLSAADGRMRPDEESMSAPSRRTGKGGQVSK